MLPLFHVTGMQTSMNGAIYNAATVVLLPRWDRDAAALCVQRYRVTGLALITAMVIDFMSNPKLSEYDLSSVRRIGGGGAAMPKAVAQAMEKKFNLKYGEGYGMSETMAATHANPPDRPKEQCLGIPLYDVDSRIIDPVTLQELPQGETGEIVVHGPQVMTRLLEPAAGHRRRIHSRSTASASCAPATSRTSTTRATTSSSIA